MHIVVFLAKIDFQQLDIILQLRHKIDIDSILQTNKLILDILLIVKSVFLACITLVLKSKQHVLFGTPKSAVRLT